MKKLTILSYAFATTVEERPRMMYARKTLELCPLKAAPLGYLRPVFYVLTFLIILLPARGQDVAAPVAAPPLFTDNFSAFKQGGLLHPILPGCRNAFGNDLRGRLCFYADDLFGPSAVAHALFASSFSELRNHPQIWRQDRDDTVDRFAFFYEAKAARDTGQFLAGYLHHENFRPVASGKIGIRSRTKAALISVVRTRSSEDGSAEVAFAPIAGALSSGFVGAADYRYRNRNLFETGLRYSAGAYGCRFVSAVFQEFKPDLLNFSNKVVRGFR